MTGQVKVFGQDAPTEQEIDEAAFDSAEEIEPLNDQVLVFPMEGPGKTKGGIFVPKTVRQDRECLRGKVLAVGEGTLTSDGTLKPLRVKVGQQVLFSKFAGVDIQVDGQEVKIVRAGDIIGRINKKAKQAPAEVA